MRRWRSTSLQAGPAPVACKQIEVASLPRTTTAKIQRFKLRELAQQNRKVRWLPDAGGPPVSTDVGWEKKEDPEQPMVGALLKAGARCETRCPHLDSSRPRYGPGVMSRGGGTP
jgi:hypothetical protein